MFFLKTLKGKYDNIKMREDEAKEEITKNGKAIKRNV